MSGFLPDLASWALRGGAGAEDGDTADDAAQGSTSAASSAMAPPPMTAQELRAQRLERLGGAAQPAAATQQVTPQAPEPMEIDDAPTPAPVVVVKENNTMNNNSMDISSEQQQPAAVKPTKAKRAKNELSPSEQAKKLHRKKEALLKKTLLIVLKGSASSTSSSLAAADAASTYETIDIGNSSDDDSGNEISISTVAEIFATRLQSSSSTTGKEAIPYLGACYARTRDELKQQKSSSAAQKNHAELAELLREVGRQCVNYAATCLSEPDLFGMAQDSAMQLAHCLLHVESAASFTMGGSSIGSGSGNESFYQLVMAELEQQDPDALVATVHTVTEYYGSLLKKCDSILDSTDTPGGGGPVVPAAIVSACVSVCSYKGAAKALAAQPNFLLPAAHTPAARHVIRPTMPAGANPLTQLLAGGNPGAAFTAHLGRSGPSLAKSTLLGAAMDCGAPPSTANPAFHYNSVLRMPTNAVEQVTRQQRQQLHHYQAVIHQFVMAVIKAGPAARASVLQWFQDALLVNTGATALRPDMSKVSSVALRLNVQAELLQLCEPIVNPSTAGAGANSAQSKQHLIDAGFLSSRDHHGGVFATEGDDAVPRLGSMTATDDATAMTDSATAATAGGGGATSAPPFSPKNAFIPTCFFFCARALHFGLVPGLRAHESLLRMISHLHYQSQQQNRDAASDPRFANAISRQRADEVALFSDVLLEQSLRFIDYLAKVLHDYDEATLRLVPEEFVSDICDVLVGMVDLNKAQPLAGIEFRHVFQLVVKLLSPKYASMVKNYNLRAQLGDVLHEIFLPPSSGGSRRDKVPASVYSDPLAGGQTYLLADPAAQETLAPSLLLLYGEVEHTGYYDKMSHRAKIASLIKYLWESKEHRPAFQNITQNKDSFIKFANGIMNETNDLISKVMQKLPEIRLDQEKIKNVVEWGRLSEDEQKQITERLADNERDVKGSLPLCNKTLQMFGYLNTDKDIRSLFLLEELCSRLVQMLLHVLTKLVGSKGLDLKVDNPEQYDFRPKEMLRDLCAIFALFAENAKFQEGCAVAGCDPSLLRTAVKTCKRLNLLTGESMVAFELLPGKVEEAARLVAIDNELLADAPDEFLDAIMSTFMKDPVLLPSNHCVDRSTITQHLLNDPTDPFNRKPLTIDQVTPATELKEKMNAWLEDKRRGSGSK